MAHETRQTDQSHAPHRPISIILVHGTGASTEGPAGSEQWWQPESAFARGLVDQLCQLSPEDRQYSVEAFKWSGENSEAEREKAGAKLAVKLAALENSGTPYHLIGHSHGGSVLWHALVQAASEGNHFRHLRSWITIGTPFLEFSPRNGLYLLLCLLSLIILGLAVIPLDQIAGDLLDEAVLIFSSAPTPAIVAILLGLASMLGLSLFSLLSLYRQVRLRAVRWRSRRAFSCLTTLSKHWLGIAHDLDEPINGLAATLSRPPEIAPRTRSGPARRLIYWLASPYNWIVAPLVDAFVWDISISRLQGRGLAGTIMTACRTSPPRMTLAWPPLPPDLRSGLSRSANEAASQTAAALREELLKVGTGTEPAERIARVMSWDELIHTTYFANPGILELCVAFMRGHDELATPTVTTARPSSREWIATGPSIQVEKRRHFEPINLYLAKAAGLAATAAVLSFGTVAAHQAWLSPYTNRYQIDAIGENMTKPQFTGMRDSPSVGVILIRLVALDAKDAVFASLSNIRNPNTAIMAAQLVAYGLGFYGDEAGLKRLIDDVYRSAPTASTTADEDLTLKTYALAGAVAGNSALKTGLAAELHSVLAQEGGVFNYGGPGPRDIAASALLQMGNASDVNILLNSMADIEGCKKTLAWIEANQYKPAIQSMSEKLKACMDDQSRASVSADRKQDNQMVVEAAMDGVAEADPNDVPANISQLLSRKDYMALSTMVLSWNKDLAKQVVEEVYDDDSWLEMIKGLEEAGQASAVTRVKNLYELRLREQMEKSSPTEISTKKLERVDDFAARMLLIDRRSALEAEAKRLDLESVEDPTSPEEEAAAAGIIWHHLGNKMAAKASLGKALELAPGEVWWGFPFAIWLADKSVLLDRNLTKTAIEKAISVYEYINATGSRSPLYDQPYTFNDVVRLYVKIGEYRLAREAAERVGQSLGGIELSEGDMCQEENRQEENRQEENGQEPTFESIFEVGGVFDGYIQILDAEIRKRSVPGQREIVDLVDKWPKLAPIYSTIDPAGC